MGRRRFKPHLLSTAFLLFSSASLWAQGQIIGEVHVNGGDFPGPVLVELQLHGSPINSVYTDEQGKFGFGPLGTNEYHVLIRDERFYPVDERALLDVAISATLMVQIHLAPRSSGKKDAPVDRTAGSNPNLVDAQDYHRNVPKVAVKEFDKGVKADKKGKPDDALRHYQKALAIAPDFYPAYNNLGSLYLRKADFAAARAQFEKAIQLNQSDAEARLNLANVLLMIHNYDGALQNVQEGLRRAPQSAFGYFLLGSIDKQIGKLPEAEHALRQALALDPQMSRIRLELVNIYLIQEKKIEAREELRGFLKDSPNDPLVPQAKAVLAKLDASSK